MSGPILLALRLLLAASLYVFLGWAFLSLWRDLKQRGASLASRQPPLLALTSTLASEGVPFQTRLPELTLGRDPACEFPLEHPTISARHARLFFRQGHWWVEDLRSTNGTFLNDEPVSMPVILASQDHLRCGQITLLIEIEDGA
ncbi:MAG: FHA domain-containing protein [Anaerolineales bacterium]|nr:FHA domain-containing protein [Anaerolineales bacterium]